MSMNAVWISGIRTPGRWITRLALVGTLFSTTGCVDLGTILYFAGVGQTQKVKAQFKLPPGSVVVLVDDDLDLVQPALAREVLVDSLAAELKKHKITDRVTKNEEIARVRQAATNFDKMSVREVGRRVNADTMLWLSVEDFFVENDLETSVNDARFAVKLKVFNVHEEDRHNIRLWPPEREGRRIAIVLPPHEVRQCRNRAEVHRKLADKMAVEVARLFYNHTIEQ